MLHTYDIYIQRDIVRQTDGMMVGGWVEGESSCMFMEMNGELGIFMTFNGETDILIAILNTMPLSSFT